MKKLAFTLIELLVVVAIISLLVSILLPSLQKAKELAKVAVCGSQLANISVGGGLYGADYDGLYGSPGVIELTGTNFVSPAAFGAGYPYGDSTVWLPLEAWKSHMCAFIWYWPYLGKVARYTENLGEYWTLDKIPEQPKTHGVWACPSNKTDWVGYSYLYNEYLSNMRNSTTLSNPDFRSSRIHQGDVPNPADVYTHGDESSSVHTTGQNYLLADGHVEFYHVNETPPAIYPE